MYKFKENALSYDTYKSACDEVGLELELKDLDYILQMKDKTNLKVEETKRNGVVNVTVGTKQKVMMLPFSILEEIEEKKEPLQTEVQNELEEQEISEATINEKVSIPNREALPTSGSHKHSKIDKILIYVSSVCIIGLLGYSIFTKEDFSSASNLDSLKTDVLLQSKNTKELQPIPTKEDLEFQEYVNISNELRKLLEDKEKLNNLIRKKREEQKELYLLIF